MTEPVILPRADVPDEVECELTPDGILGAVALVYRDAGWCRLNPGAVATLRELIGLAILAEREACAKVAEAFAYNEHWSRGAKVVAAIRARSAS